MIVTLVVTHDCQLACRYCYAGPKRKRTMPWPVVIAGLDLAFDQVSHGDILQLSFFGGEPLLEFDLIQRATDYAKSLADKKQVKLKLQLTTNGLVLTPEMLDWLARSGFYIGFSFDGNRAAHDANRCFRDGSSSYDATLERLKMTLDKLPKTSVLSVIDPANIFYAADSVAFLYEEVGAKLIHQNANYTGVWSEAEFTIWEDQYKRVADWFVDKFRAGQNLYLNWINAKLIVHLKDGYKPCDKCALAEKEFAVAASGNLYPCERLVGEDDKVDLLIGHVSTGFSPMRQVIAALRHRHDPACEDCSVREFCMNWCGCVNYEQTGEIHKPGETLCRSEKFIIREALRAGEILFNEANPLFMKKFYYEEPTAFR